MLELTFSTIYLTIFGVIGSLSILHYAEVFIFIVKQLHREFLRAGSTVMQTFTFYASEDKLDNRGNECASKFGVSILNYVLG